MSIPTLPGVMFASLVASSAAMAQTNCPAPDAPPGARTESVSSSLVVNGQRARLSRFTLAGGADDVLAFYRTRFGEHHVENQVRDARTIASEQQGCFVTVAVPEAIDGHVTATVMSTQIGGQRSRSRVEMDTEAMLPAGSGVVQTQEFEDPGIPSLLIVAANRDGVARLAQSLSERFQDRGFRLVQRDDQPRRGRSAAVLRLASASEDATVTVTDVGDYRSLVVQRNRRAK